MFLDNEYSVEYFNIVNQYRKNQQYSKNSDTYCEKHHIIPRCMGGSNKKDNIVFLSAKDHFRCHTLLVKFTEGDNNGKMWSALWRMMNKQSKNQQRDLEINAYDYEEARKQHSIAQSIRMSGQNNPFFGKHHTKESKEIMSNVRKGKTYEEIYGESHAAELRQRRKEESTGRTLPAEARIKVSKANSGRKRNDLTLRNLQKNAELKKQLILILENTPYYKGMFTHLAQKLKCDHNLVSRVYYNIEVYKKALGL